MKNIAIVGAGTVGASWAAFFAICGKTVKVYDAHPETRASADSTIKEHIAGTVELGLCTPEAAETANVSVVHTLEDACQDADFVQESALETYETKRELFSRMDAITKPECILASSSSGLLISEIQSVMNRPERALIAHPFNPPHLIPLVELVSGKQTSPKTIAKARQFFTELGKEPVVLNKEVPGHIANRLAAALWREAIELVAQGIANVEDVDTALRAGPGLRWAIMGQHMIYHLGGGKGGYGYFIDHIGKAFEEYWRTMPTWTEIPEEARKAVVEGVEKAAQNRTVSELSQERDRRLATLLKALGRTR